MSYPRPRKSLGQHFLHEQGFIDAILRAFAADADDVAVEIGPGRGALTTALAGAVKRLHVIELDTELAHRLRLFAPEFPSLSVHHADALKTNFCSLDPCDSIRIIGNLPYNISTPLIFHLLSQSKCIRDMWFMLQKEVGDRITARPGNKTYGRLSVMVQQRCVAESLFPVPSGAFTPPPRVESVFLRLRPHEEMTYRVKNSDAFGDLVNAAFTRRRKTLRNALAGYLDEHQMRTADIDPGLRPEQIGVADYVKLANLL